MAEAREAAHTQQSPGQEPPRKAYLSPKATMAKVEKPCHEGQLLLWG